MQHILCRNRLRTDSGVCESHIFRNIFIQMMTNHQHIQMLIYGIYSERHGGIRRRRQYILAARCTNNIRCMPTACTLGMECMYGTATDGIQCIFHAACLIQCICMDSNLDIIFISHIQAMIDCCRSGAKVFMDFHPHRASLQLLNNRFFIGTISFSIETKIHRIFFRSF